MVDENAARGAFIGILMHTWILTSVYHVKVNNDVLSGVHNWGSIRWQATTFLPIYTDADANMTLVWRRTLWQSIWVTINELVYANQLSYIVRIIARRQRAEGR